MIAEFIAEYQRESQKERLESLASRSDAERRLTKVLREIDALVTAIDEGMYNPSMKAKMDGLETERADLAARLEALPAVEPVLIHPALADVYARKIAGLAIALNDDGTRTEAADLLRGLIDKIILRPDPDAPNGHLIALYGELGAIMSLCGNGMGRHAKAHAGGVGFKQLTMVAGAGFEPAAFRLRSGPKEEHLAVRFDNVRAKPFISLDYLTALNCIRRTGP